jgi:hypothetical protein
MRAEEIGPEKSRFSRLGNFGTNSTVVVSISLVCAYETTQSLVLLADVGVHFNGASHAIRATF